MGLTGLALQYYQSIEPPNGDAISAILPALKAFQ